MTIPSFIIDEKQRKEREQRNDRAISIQIEYPETDFSLDITREPPSTPVDRGATVIDFFI